MRTPREALTCPTHHTPMRRMASDISYDFFRCDECCAEIRKHIRATRELYRQGLKRRKWITRLWSGLG